MCTDQVHACTNEVLQHLINEGLRLDKDLNKAGPERTNDSNRMNLY